jgi:phage tail-like protein
MSQAIPDGETMAMPLSGFNFHVAIEVADAKGEKSPQLCNGSFSEVSGLEASMEAKAIKSGGRNYGAHQRAGMVNFASVVLKRGMSDVRDLWKWWDLVGAGGKYGKASRCTVYVTHLDEQRRPVLVWKLENAMPVKFKAGDFSSKSADVAIEELHFVHEGLSIEPPGGSK